MNTYALARLCDTPEAARAYLWWVVLVARLQDAVACFASGVRHAFVSFVDAVWPTNDALETLHRLHWEAAL